MKEHLTKNETDKLFNLTKISPRSRVSVGIDYGGMPIYEMRYSISELISMLPLNIDINRYYVEQEKYDSPTDDVVLLGMVYDDRYNEWYTKYENVDYLFYEGSAPELIDSLFNAIFDLVNEWKVLEFN
jgi:hypothetical protein